MRRFEQVHDVSLIRAIKNLLDFGLGKQAEKDEALEASIDRGFSESEKGEARPHDDVMSESDRAIKHDVQNKLDIRIHPEIRLIPKSCPG